MSEHSPAPWRLEDGCLYDANGNWIAELFEDEDGLVMVAAPDLLAAAEAVTESFAGFTNLPEETRLQLRAAIAKARRQS